MELQSMHTPGVRPPPVVVSEPARNASIINEPAIKRVDGSERQRVARFMAAQFHRHFKATISDDTDEVYAVFDQCGDIVLAFGLNLSTATFFSRHYVADIQQRLDALYAGANTSATAVELAHLCVRTPRELCCQIPQLATFLESKAQVLVCTATAELSGYFMRRGLAPEHLGQARLQDLPVGQRRGWGEYYRHEPQVICGPLAQACQRLQSRHRRVIRALRIADGA